MTVLLDRGRGRQEDAGERLERTELDGLHHQRGHVGEGPPRQHGIGVVAERVGADHEQHVHAAVGAGPQDLLGVPPLLGGHDRAPDGLHLRTFLGDAEAPAAGQQQGMHARAERASVVRPPGRVAEPGADLARDRERQVGGERMLGEPFTREHDALTPRVAERGSRARFERSVVDPFPDPVEHEDLAARTRRQVLGDVVQPCPTRVHDEDLRSPRGGLADPQMQDGHLLLRIEAGEQDRGRVLDVGVRHRSLAIGDGRRRDDLGQPAVERTAMIQVVRPDHRAGELRQRVIVLVHQASAGEEGHAPGPASFGEPREDLAERGGLQPAITDQRRRDPPGGVGMPVGEPTLVTDPRIVHVGVLPGEHAHDLSATDVDTHVATRAAVLAHGIA